MRALIVVALLVMASAAYAQFNRCGAGFCPGSIMGSGFSGGSAPVVPLTNLRITDTGDFRITSAGDNRAISP